MKTPLISISPQYIGIINITPDSFSDGGLYLDPEKACSQARTLIKEGAHIIELGAESTAPDSKSVSLKVEVERLKPVVQILASEIILSIDSYKAETARLCLELGARMINDTSALRADPEMRAVVKDFDAWVVLMHAKDSPLPHVSGSKKDYKDVVEEVSAFLLDRVDYATKGGISNNKIILDPGMGRFLSHDPKYSWELLSRFQELTTKLYPFPVMIGTSRKGFLGGPVAERDPLSQLTSLWAAQKGAALIRTHNVKMLKEFVGAWEKVSFGKPNSHFPP